MGTTWHEEFRERMATFDAVIGSDSEGVSLSIKIRVVSGCYHREHSPIAYAEIDAYAASFPHDNKSVQVIEHENGPEILLCLAVTTAGLTLAKSVVDLITTIIKARSEGIKKGDRPREPLEIIVRSIQKDGEYQEEVVLRVESDLVVTKDIVRSAVEAVVQRLSKENPPKGSKKSKKR